jgi:Na+-transporting methylmalonyl-CoA/oxaloacetate decarboxylase gamma subunit
LVAFFVTFLGVFVVLVFLVFLAFFAISNSPFNFQALSRLTA